MQKHADSDQQQHSMSMSDSLRIRGNVHGAPANSSSSTTGTSSSAALAPPNAMSPPTSSMSTLYTTTPMPLPYDDDEHSDPHVAALNQQQSSSSSYRRNPAAGGTPDCVGGFEANLAHTGLSVEWQDQFRHIFANLPCAFFHSFSLLVTLFLVLVVIADRSALLSSWYLLLEGLMVTFFLFDLVSRFILYRAGGFFRNSMNVFEAILCFVCIVMFIALASSRSSLKEGRLMEAHVRLGKQKQETVEHELIVVVRFFAQALRAVLYFRNIRARRETASQGISLMHAAPSAMPSQISV